MKRRHKDVSDLIQVLTNRGVLDPGLGKDVTAGIERLDRGWDDPHETRSAVADLMRLVKRVLEDVTDKRNA